MKTTWVLFERQGPRRCLEECETPHEVNEEGFGWVKRDWKRGDKPLNLSLCHIDERGQLVQREPPIFTLTADAVRAECEGLIADRFSILWQLNAMWRLWLFLDTQTGADARTLNDQEQSEMDSIRVAFEWIDHMRHRALELTATPALAFSEPNWPEFAGESAGSPELPPLDQPPPSA